MGQKKSSQNIDTFYYENQVTDAGYKCIAGVDEVGLGSLAGPIYAAAAILNPFFVDQLAVDIPKGKRTKRVIVKDSKQLSMIERELLYPGIIANCVAYSLGIVEIDEINSVKNIMKCGQLARVRAVQNLKTKPDYILVDGIWDMQELAIPVKPIIKGDQLSLSISAASIIAKVSRDRVMMNLHHDFPMYNWVKNVGYGTKAHYEGIRQHGTCKHHRHYVIKEERWK